MLRDTIGTGVYGRAFQVTGNCAPGSCAGAESCNAVLVAGLEIVAFDASDITESGQCARGFDLLVGAQPITSAVTDDQGVYSMFLPNGSYALTAIDPVDQCPFLANFVDVSADQPLPGVVFAFNHGAL